MTASTLTHHLHRGGRGGPAAGHEPTVMASHTRPYHAPLPAVPVWPASGTTPA
jgi:hypothetical protein